MRRGITLAELLVASGIVAVLAGLLVPALTLVRNLAGATACLSNLRQVGIVTLAYADEHGDRLPAEGNKGDDDPETSPAWFHRLPSYVEQPDVRTRHGVFQCPGYDWADPRVFDHASPKSYKMNAYLDDQGRPACYRLGSCPDEATMVLFADAVAGDTGMGQWGHLFPSAIDASRHGGRVNILYLDGHGVGTVRADDDEPGAAAWRRRLTWCSVRWKSPSSR
jgi:prepilin-type processing-associated H-X9-DG protein